MPGTWYRDDSGWSWAWGPLRAHRAWPSRYWGARDGGLQLGPLTWRWGSDPRYPTHRFSLDLHSRRQIRRGSGDPAYERTYWHDAKP